MFKGVKPVKEVGPLRIFSLDISRPRLSGMSYP